MFKFFIHLIIVSIFLTFSSYAKNYEKIIINGNERISSETILVFSEIFAYEEKVRKKDKIIR